MVKKIQFTRYRKLTNLRLEFSKGINVISGTNGTCKTSILHIISNAFQAVSLKSSWVRSTDCLHVINKVNGDINPKIETLTKGDKAYNDPASGSTGTLFAIEYYGFSSLEFRRHNSNTNCRYAIKPQYKRGTQDKLPFCPTIYLSLKRLYPFGEYGNDEDVKSITKSFPPEYQQEIIEIYQRLSGLTISSMASQKMGDVKTRVDFVSNKDGIDSNTISAGEDNLLIIITALVSLRYYYENIESKNEIESVLLIDELDATLHPSMQCKLTDVFRLYSERYKIQIVLTTHSLSLIEYALEKKDNLIYLIDNISNVIEMPSPDIYKIRMYLYNQTYDSIYANRAIPLFTEDKEARIFLRCLFEYFKEKHNDFLTVSSLFHFVDANIGSNNLKSIFGDTYLIKTTLKYICVLDGDQNTNLSNQIITLPGQGSPEKVIMDYALEIFTGESAFWTDNMIIELNYGKVYFRDCIKPDIDGIQEKLDSLRAAEISTHGVERDERKSVFNKHQRFFELLYVFWIHDDANLMQVERFYKNLNIMFKKVASFYYINPSLWNV